MKIETLTILLAAFFLCLAIPYAYRTEVAQKQQVESQKNEQILLAGCENAMLNTEISSKSIYDTEHKREKAIEEFYNTVNQSYNNLTSEAKETMLSRIPCIVLVDWDGFYLCYNDVVEKEADDGSTYIEYQPITTNKFTWSETKPGITGLGSTVDCYATIVYRLDDWVDVYLSSPIVDDTALENNVEITHIEGNWEDVRDKLNSWKTTNAKIGEEMPYKDIIPPEYTDFYNTKQNIINTAIEENVNYFINTHNNNTNNVHGMEYRWIMPQYDSVDEDDENVAHEGDSFNGRMVLTPCFMAFEQSKQSTSGTNLVNIYAFTATDLQKEKIYYVVNSRCWAYGETKRKNVNVLTFHSEDCTDIDWNNVSVIFSGTYEECIEMGAIPHDVAMRESNGHIVDYDADGEIIARYEDFVISDTDEVMEPDDCCVNAYDRDQLLQP